MSLGVVKGGKDSKFNPDYQNIRDPEEVQKELNLLKNYLKDLQGDSLNFSEKMNTILKINGIVIPEFFRQMTNTMPDTDRARIASNSLSAIKDMSQILMKKREVELSEDINLNSPKFQLVFSWLIEVFNNVLESQSLSRIQINNVFTALSSELAGWEDKVSKRLKGLSSKVLDEVKNPLVKIDDKEPENEEGFQFD